MYTIDMLEQQLNDNGFTAYAFSLNENIPRDVDVYAWVASKVYKVDYDYLLDSFEANPKSSAKEIALASALRQSIKVILWDTINNSRLRIVDDVVIDMIFNPVD